MGSKLLDNSRELKLILEVADIIDELNMIQHLVKKQRKVLESLKLALRGRIPSGNSPIEPDSNIIVHDDSISGAAGHYVFAADEMLGFLRTEFSDLKKDAEYTHTMVCANT